MEGKEQIEQIALECGMPNGKAYTKTFRELMEFCPVLTAGSLDKISSTAKMRKEELCSWMKKQKSLLFHLVEGNRQMVYEDAKLVIWKEQEKFCCQVKEMWRDVTVTNGKIEVFFEET